MKYTTLLKFSIAAVSVISKHMAPAANSPALSSAIRNSRNRSSFKEVPDKFTAIGEGLDARLDAMHDSIERLAHHPPVDRGHDVVALRRRE